MHRRGVTKNGRGPVRNGKGRKVSIENMDEDEFDHQLMPPAFVVSGSTSDDEEDLNAPPTSGMEYLRRVQQEAKSVPAVVVADISQQVRANNSRMPQSSLSIHHVAGIQPAPRGFCPSLEWQRDQVAKFAEVRQSLARHKAKLVEGKVKRPRKLPLKEDGESWCKLCFGKLNVKRLWRSDTAPNNGRGIAFKSTSDSAFVSGSSACNGDRNIQSGPASYVNPAPIDDSITGISQAAGSSFIDDSNSIGCATAADSTSVEVVSQAAAGMEVDRRRDATPIDAEKNIHGAQEQGTPPLLSIVAFLDQVTVSFVLKYHLDWMSVTGFSTEQGRWFYALMACLEKPLDPDVCSLLRDLARACSALRATLDSADDPHLVQLNLLICLVARYFQQSDLADQPPS